MKYQIFRFEWNIGSDNHPCRSSKGINRSPWRLLFRETNILDQEEVLQNMSWSAQTLLWSLCWFCSFDCFCYFTFLDEFLIMFMTSETRSLLLSSQWWSESRDEPISGRFWWRSEASSKLRPSPVSEMKGGGHRSRRSCCSSTWRRVWKDGCWNSDRKWRSGTWKARQLICHRVFRGDRAAAQPSGGQCREALLNPTPPSRSAFHFCLFFTDIISEEDRRSFVLGLNAFVQRRQSADSGGFSRTRKMRKMRREKLMFCLWSLNVRQTSSSGRKRLSVWIHDGQDVCRNK